MRVTHNGLALNLLRNLQANLQRLSDLQNTVATGKRIRSPSDDPSALSSVLALHQVQTAMTQYRRNIDDAGAHLRVASQAAASAVTVLQYVRTLAVQAGSEALSARDLQTIRRQVDAALDDLVALANTALGGRHVFGGTRTTTAPFVRTGDLVTYQGNSDPLSREVEAGVVISASVPGDAVFVSGAEGAFPAVTRLLAALAVGDHAGVRAEIAGLDRAITVLTDADAALGARSARLEAMTAHLAEMEGHLAALTSAREDADLARVIMQLRLQETTYQAALDVGARLLPMSLLDFLR